MPKLPDPYEFASAGPRPTRNINTVPTPDVRNQSTIGLLNELTDMAAKEADRLDDIAAEDALNKLREKRLAMTYGDDGFTKVRGGAVVKRPVLDEYSTSFTKETEALGKDLKSARARARFSQRAAQESLSFRQDLMQHVGRQVDDYEVATTEKSASNAAAEVRARGGDPIALDRELGVVKDRIGVTASRLGLDGELLEDFTRRHLGIVHTSAIEALIDPDRPDGANPELAEKLFKTAVDRGELTAAQIESLSGKIESSATFTAGNRIFAGALEKKLSHTEALAYFNDQSKGRKDVFTAAKARWDEYVLAKNREDLERKGGLVMDFNANETWDGYRKVKGSDAFQQLDQDQRGALDTWMRAQLDQKGRQRDADKVNDPEALALYYELIDAEEFATLSPQYLRSYTPALGKALTGAAMRYHKELTTGAAKFDVDKALMMSNLADTAPHLISPKTKDQKAEAARFKALVHLSLQDWKDRNQGKTPNQTEVQEIIKLGSREYTKPGLLFDDDIRAYNLPEVPADFINKIREHARKTNQKMPTAQEVQDRWAFTQGFKPR